MAPPLARGAVFAPLLAALLCPAGAQFGGGGFGGGGYNPPAPICPAFKCPKGQKAVGKADHQIWSYGCKDSGMNILNFDPNNPLGGVQQQKSVDRCCVERDICKQTCGMTSKACHDLFQKCSTKVCKGDQNCQLQAMMSEIMAEPYEEEAGKPYKYDPEETKCKGYNKGQAAACACVPGDDWKLETESKLKSFYGKFNPEKLDSEGEIKDVEEVWKKWKGKEPDMFLALATKYKEKAVQMRTKPKPPPYKPPPKEKKEDEEEEEEAPAEEEPAEPTSSGGGGEGSSADPEELAFEEKLSALREKKAKAAEDEEYELADQLKEEGAELKRAEMQRLQDRKAKALADEDYLTAKRLKARLAKMEL